MKNKSITQFIKGINKGPFKVLQENNNIEHVVTNSDYDNIYCCAVYQGYLDMCRTISYSRNGITKEKVEKSCEMISNELKKYFDDKPKNSEQGFDTWYLGVLNAVGINKTPNKELTVGQLQKIINMAFKYLYCCDEFRGNRYEHFKFCHMPLDSYTLAWYHHECSKKADSKKWSKLLDYTTYFGIVDETREILKSKIVLEEEFDIWQNEKEKVENKELLKLLKSFEHRENLNDNLIKASLLIQKEIE